MDTLKNLHIHHIGYLVKNIDKAEAEFVALGYTIINEKCRDDYRKVDIVFLEKEGYCVELISPYAEDSVVSGLMKRFKNSPYHICYETDDYDKCFELLRAQGYVPFDENTPAPAISGRRVQFFTHPKLGMIEILNG
ncbi:MAG: VOC family protein [Lachnospiraceae bacterium]|nr:VOC family protein [Lachnospiraceae bacterium]